MTIDSDMIYNIMKTGIVLTAVFIVVFVKVRQERGSRKSRTTEPKTLSGPEELNKKFEANLQSSNCIVSATCNILWHHGHHGFPELIEGVDFPGLEERIDAIINSKGGYANNNVPETVEGYVSTYTHYKVEVNNLWHPSFNDVKRAAAKNPCLLGFAAGPDSYGSDAGHMTACVWADVYDKKKMVGVIDGHKTNIVFWVWQKHNDFMSEFIFSKKDGA